MTEIWGKLLATAFLFTGACLILASAIKDSEDMKKEFEKLAGASVLGTVMCFVFAVGIVWSM